MPKGLSAGLNVGISKMSAVGEVYTLKKVSDFSGTYTKLEASVAVGGGVGGLRLQNENGVIMNLRSRTKGLDTQPWERDRPYGDDGLSGVLSRLPGLPNSNIDSSPTERGAIKAPFLGN